MSVSRRVMCRSEVLPGRLYVGLMAQGHTADTATVHALIVAVPVDADRWIETNMIGVGVDVYPACSRTLAASY